MTLRDRLEAADDRRILREWPRMMQRGPRWFTAQHAANSALRLSLVVPAVRLLDLGVPAIWTRTLSVMLLAFLVTFVVTYVLGGKPAAFEWRRRGERYAALTGDSSGLRLVNVAEQTELEPVLGGVALAAILLATWAGYMAVNEGSAVLAALATVLLLIAAGFAGRMVHVMRQSPFQPRDDSQTVNA